MQFRGIIYAVLCFVWSCGQANAGQAPSEFLVTKWKARFAVLDVNHDSILSIADAIEMSNIFTDLHNMTGDEAQYMGARIATWWNTCVGKQRTGDIIEVDFLTEHADAIADDPESFETRRRDCFYATANIADVDGDVHLSETEWVIWLRSYGRNGNDAVRAMFLVFNPINGRVPIGGIVEQLVEVVVDEENKTSELTNFCVAEQQFENCTTVIACSNKTFKIEGLPT